MFRTAIDGRYALAGEFVVAKDTQYGQEKIATLGLGDDGWVAIWSQSAVVGADGTVRMQRFDLSGHKVGEEIGLGAGSLPVVSKLTDGGFAVAWAEQSSYP